MSQAIERFLRAFLDASGGVALYARPRAPLVRALPPDQHALRNDWCAIGKDFHVAITKARENPNVLDCR